MFWTVAIEGKMKDPEILAEAMKDIEANLKVSNLTLRLSFEDAIRGAEASLMRRRRWPSGDSRRDASIRGGLAPREDALQEDINRIVRSHPLITEAEMLIELDKNEWVTVKIEMRTSRRRQVISYIDWNQERVTVSSVKDRLSRARRKNSL
jgi:hypothetical protein